jgi:hypothetical protein
MTRFGTVNVHHPKNHYSGNQVGVRSWTQNDETIGEVLRKAGYEQPKHSTQQIYVKKDDRRIPISGMDKTDDVIKKYGGNRGILSPHLDIEVGDGYRP